MQQPVAQIGGKRGCQSELAQFEKAYFKASIEDIERNLPCADSLIDTEEAVK